MAAALATGALVCGWAPPADASASVTLAVLPPGATVGDLAHAGLSPGVLSAGIGDVPAAQTFLDLSQGNRVDPLLYDRDLPAIGPFGDQVPGWARIVARAGSAPADLAPGLLASELRSAGLPTSAETGLGASALAAADRHGLIRRSRPGRCVRLGCRGLAVIRATVPHLEGLVRRLQEDDLLIAFPSPPAGDHETLPIGVAGAGFDGDLTSDSTRMNGYVLSTDIAPTILRRLGVPIPDEMNGEPIRTEGSIDPSAIDGRADRMEAIPDRRTPIVAGCLAGWVMVAAAVALFIPPIRRRAFAWLALVIAYMPLLLLAGAALEPAAATEALLVGFGAAALAALTLALTRGWWALAIAGAVTTGAYAIDVIAGSHLTSLSLLGPNPVLGVRFYGIGNELEAILAVIVPAAVGAALTARAAAGRPPTRRAAIAAFLGAGGLAAAVFAAGRFGADVGAAIVLPVGAGVAALTVARAEGGPVRSGAWTVFLAVVGAAIAGLTALALIDLVSGGNAHLTRSVLDVGGAGDLANVAERRLTLSAHDFARAAATPLFWLLIAGILVALIYRRRIGGWFAGAPPAGAGLLGACAAIAVGVLVNDSGASFLAIGAVALGAVIAFGWSQMQRDLTTQSGK